MRHLARRVPTLRRLQPLLPVALAALAVGGPVEAQRALPTVDVGGASMRYADSLVARGATVSPAITLEWARATVGGGGTFSQFGQGWSTQGTVNASVYTPTLWRLVGELAGSAGGSAHRDGARTGQGLALARAYVMGSRGGAWGGAGGGRTWDGLVWRGLRQAEVGAWGELAAGNTTLATVTPTVVDDTIRYTDVQLAMRWSVARVDLGLSAGARTGERLPPYGGTAKRWGSGSATMWVARRLAVTASAGTYPVDLTQGFPGGRFVTAGFRVGVRPTRGATAEPATSEAATDGGTTRPSGAITEFHATSAGAGRRALRVRAPAASSVEIMGDFTSWQPVRLARQGDGWWTASLPIPRGTHQMNVRVDGGAWGVPPGLTAVKDEFGGLVALLVVQ